MKKKHTDADDFEISEFELDENQSDALEAPTEIDQKSTPSGREILNALIEHDAADAKVQMRAQKEEQVQSQPVVMFDEQPRIQRKNSVPRSSTNVVDLRKHYLIEKHGLDTIERPKQKKPIFKLKKRERVRWHVPEPQISEPTEEEGESSEQSVVFQKPSTASLSFALILLILIVPIFGIPTVSSLFNFKDIVWSTSVSAVENVESGLNQLSESNFSEAIGPLENARDQFQSVQRSIDSLNSFALRVAEIIPGLGPKVTLGEAAADIGYHSSEIARLLSSASTEKNVYTTDTLKQVQLHFREVTQTLTGVEGTIQKLNPSEFSEPLQTQIRFVQANFYPLLRSAKRMNEVFRIAHQLLGGDTLQRHLVLFQNNREIRPTGGFIGSYALVDVARGSIQDIDFPGGGTYDIEGAFKHSIVPPEPLRILNDEWHMWDANWWPDFPTSAKKVAWFYSEAGGPSVDSVIAINSDVMVSLLDQFGAVELPEYGLTVDSDNFYNVIQEQVELNYDKEENKPKKVLADLLPIVIERILAPSELKKSITTLLTGLLQRDIQIYSFDENIEASIDALGWSGAQHEATHDYLQVVSTNIAGGKSDAAIYETIDHRGVIKDDGSIYVTLTIEKQHQASPTDQFAYVPNVDYMRIYVPQGSTLVRSAGFIQPDAMLYRPLLDNQEVASDVKKEEAGITYPAGTTAVYTTDQYTVFADWMQTQPGETSTATITYKLPFSIDIESDATIVPNPAHQVSGIDTYSLYIQKQSGKKQTLINSSVLIPERYAVVWDDASSNVTAGYTNGIYTMSSPLTSDILYAFALAEAQ